MPNGVTMDREGNIVYCDLAKQAVMRVSQDGQVSLIADQVGDVKLTMPNFASYDAEGNLYVSNSSSAPTLEKGAGRVGPAGPRMARWSVSDRTAKAMSLPPVFTLPTVPPSRRMKTRSTCWKAPGTTVCAFKSRKTGLLAHPKYTQKTSPPCPTEWPLTLTAISTSRCRPRSGAHMRSRALLIRASTWRRPIRSSRWIPMVSGVC